MMHDGSNEPTLAQALKAAFNNMLSEMHTVLPGMIDNYDRSTHKATIKPLLKKRYKNGSILELPSIVNVPIVWPRTMQGGLSLPLTKGDGVLIVFSERSLEEFLALGREVAPSDPRKFDLTDAIAIPGLFAFTETGKETSTTDLELIFNNTSLTFKESGDIEIKGGNTITIKQNGDIELGTTSLKALITEDIFTSLNAHTHTGVTVGTGVTGAPTFVPPLSTLLHATQKVKGQ